VPSDQSAAQQNSHALFDHLIGTDEGVATNRYGARELWGRVGARELLGAFGKTPECPKIFFFLTWDCLKLVFEIQTIV